MSRREELQTIFENIPGVAKAYYQPPSNLSMDYPCIKYRLSGINSRKANNKLYNSMNMYEVIIIDKDPESSIVDSLLTMEYSRFQRHYVSDGLNHFVFNIYY